MRTTVDIADDVLLAARDHAAREHKSIGTVISELARESLNSRHSGKRGGRFAVLPHRDEVITVEHVRSL